jgi:hypothetical protein
MGPAQVGLAIQPTQKVRYVAQITGIVASSQYGEARAGTPLQAFFSLRQIIWAEIVGTTFFLLVGVSRFSGRRRAAPRTGGLRVFRMGVLLSPRDGSRKQSPPTPAPAFRLMPSVARATRLCGSLKDRFAAVPAERVDTRHRYT